MDFTTITAADLTAALAKISLSDMSAEDLAAVKAERKAGLDALFALEGPTVEQANVATVLVASVKDIEDVEAERDATAKKAAADFAAAKTAYAALTASGEGEGDDADEEADEDADESDEDESDEDESDEADETEEVETEEVEAAVEDKKKDEPVTASVNHATAQKIRPSAAKAVGAKTKRRTAASAAPVVITAGADIPNVPSGSPLADMSAVAAALIGRTEGFAPYNQHAAQAAYDASGGQPVLTKFAVASFGVNMPDAHKGGKGDADYNAVKAARKSHVENVQASMRQALSGKPATLTAAAQGWCAPSEIVYSWIADYVVDGLMTQPEIAAPRGGLMLTEGPQLAQTTYADTDDFGFGGTEAEALAGYTKTCETIECPEFVDHRLDFSGYCWKVPILTESAYPELITDALRLSDVLYAHKMNRRFINDTVALSTEVDATTALGGVFTDTLEAFTQVAIKERRWWNIGENAAMEIKLPQIARDIFKFDMARRSGLALDDIATDQKVAAHFANHNFAVEYVSDWQDRQSAAPATPDWPATIKGLIYPAGTFARAIKPVIQMSAVHDAASLSVNEYTGVFFEQGVKTIKMGYRSHVVEIPVCVAGATGANIFACEAGSF